MENIEADDRLLDSILEAARILDVGRTTIYTLIKDGDLKSIKIRNRHLVIRASINQLIKRLLEKAA
jgi:excisionase family DNA binding protein